MENRVNVTISPSDKKAILDAIATIKAKLPFLIGLEPEERKRYPSMDNTRYPFVKQAINAATSNDKLKPQFYELEHALNDLMLSEDLDEIHAALAELTQMIEDTRRVSGSEAYVVALAIYNTAKRGAAKGIAGIAAVYAQLKVFFESQGNNLPKNGGTQPKQ